LLDRWGSIMAIEKIGVLLVHGIGTQKPNQHLVGESRNIVAALGEEVASITVVDEPTIAPSAPNPYVADFDKNIVRVDVVTRDPRPRHITIEFNEVYWADLGEPPTLPRQVKFWFWALSMWAVAGRENTRLAGFEAMYVPKDGRLKYWGRFVLGFYGALFLLGAGTVGLLNIILDRLKLPRVLISDILTAYVGDVMLYSQPRRDTDPVVSEMGEPPRAEIRARMVDAVVEFASRNYSQWFILAHSLGSVVAYNALMETGAALPNYLSEARWRQVKQFKIDAGPLPTCVAPVPGFMLPRRPVWLSPNDGIDRRVLFSRLRGLLTYGAAIGKLRAMWPIIVPANRDEYVFPDGFEWFNVYDPTDPVSGRLKAYGPPQGQPLVTGTATGRPASAAMIKESIPYKAGWIWLLSHLQYLTCPPPNLVRPKQLLVFKVASWLIDGTFDAAGLRSAAPSVVLRTLLRVAEVLFIGLVVWLAIAALLWLLAKQWLSGLEWTEWPTLAHTLFFVAVLFNLLGWVFDKVTEKGCLQRLRQRIMPHEPSRWLRVATMVGAAIVAWFSWPVASAIVASERQFWANLGRELNDMLGGYTKVRYLTDTLNHPDPANMAVGLLCLTVVVIIVLGGLRWLFQPLQAR
jgi:hypothetical protein